MISKIKAAVAGASTMFLALPVVVGAQYAVPTDSFGLAQGATVGDVVEQVLLFLLGFLAVLAILMIVISGIIYMTSAGDEGRIESAKKYLTYAIIGLVVALLGWVIVTVVSDALEAG